ncbi:hypothetical protein BST61_g4079 [Cercospora zeina]
MNMLAKNMTPLGAEHFKTQALPTSGLDRKLSFINGLVKLTKPVLPHDTLNQPTTFATFNPFDFIFLSSAPEEIISLLARLCGKARPSKVLTLPAELRVKIYKLAFESHWEWCKVPVAALDLEVRSRILVTGCIMHSMDKYNVRCNAMDLEPPFFRTCKTFRKEGMWEYKKLLRAICDVGKRREEEEAMGPERMLNHGVTTAAYGKRYHAAGAEVNIDCQQQLPTTTTSSRYWRKRPRRRCRSKQCSLKSRRRWRRAATPTPQ